MEESVHCYRHCSLVHRGTTVLPSSVYDIFPNLNKHSHDVMCNDPVIIRLNGFLSPEECNHVIQISRLLVKPCESIGASNRNLDDDKVKVVKNNSWIMWMKHGEESHPTIAGFMSRIQDAFSLHLPLNNELMQVHFYEVNQVCEPHQDYYETSNCSFKRFGQRTATILFYLNNPLRGGQTNFPRLGVNIPARIGDVILFFNCTREGAVDPRTLHSGEPVQEGYKWIGIKVINEDITREEIVPGQQAS